MAKLTGHYIKILQFTVWFHGADHRWQLWSDVPATIWMDRSPYLPSHFEDIYQYQLAVMEQNIDDTFNFFEYQ